MTGTTCNATKEECLYTNPVCVTISGKNNTGKLIYFCKYIKIIENIKNVESVVYKTIRLYWKIDTKFT